MATRTQSLTVPAKDNSAQECHCGCSPCDGTCCRLDCIVKPHFFCGQLLTDADLSALLKWSRDRFGLSRYRHGWGVVCGLDVHCDPKVPTGVIVTPGYAVDCCGDDIIVCNEAPLDLKGACREDEDPCADLRRQVQRVGQGTPIPMGEGGINRIPGETGAGIGNEKPEVPRAVDIYLRYDETPSDPTTALGRSSCKQVAECEYSRTRETYKLSWKLAVDSSDPMSTRAKAWYAGYEKCLEVLRNFQVTFSNGFPGADVRRWLLRWIDDHPQYYLCQVRDALCQASDSSLQEESGLVRILFMMVQNCRNAYLNCGCFDCDDDAGVLLARVWLLPDDRNRDQGCRLVSVDPYPPYRRPLQPECWPAPLGSVNVGRFIWHRWEEVCRATADLGLRVTPREFSLPNTLAELEKRLNCNLFVGCDDQRVALTYATAEGKRVVGFCDATVTPVETGTIEVSVTHSPPSETVGNMVTFHYKVRNPNNRDLTGVRAICLVTSPNSPDDDFAENIGTLSSGQTYQWDRQRTLVHAASASTTVTARGVDSASGQPVSQTAANNYSATTEPPQAPPPHEPMPRDPSPTGPIPSNPIPGAPILTATAASDATPLPDNLTEINQIGPGRAKALEAGGINSFSDLAATSVERFKELVPGVSEELLKEWIEEAKAKTQ